MHAVKCAAFYNIQPWMPCKREVNVFISFVGGGGEGAVLKISTERTLEEDTEIPFT